MWGSFIWLKFNTSIWLGNLNEADVLSDDYKGLLERGASLMATHFIFVTYLYYMTTQLDCMD